MKILVDVFGGHLFLRLCLRAVVVMALRPPSLYPQDPLLTTTNATFLIWNINTG